MARNLTIIILIAFATYLTALILNLILDKSDLPTSVVAFVGCVLLVISWWLLKRGHLHASGMSVVLIGLATVTAFSTVGQGIRDVALFGFPIIFIFAGLTLSRAFFRLCVGFALAAISWLALGEANGWFVTQPFPDPSNRSHLLILAFLFLVAASAVDLLATNLHRNLEQARNEIAQRKQAEAQLLLQSAALNAAANAIAITDRAGIIQWINPAFFDLTGYSAAEAIGKNLWELVNSGDQAQVFYQNLWDTILAGQTWRGEIINRRKDGTLYPEEETITPVRDAQGEISHFIAIKQDITLRKALEAENQKLTEQFYQAQKMDSIGQLAGGIAHDFNNLLVPIVGYAELGMMTIPPDNQLYANFEQIKGAGERAANLTRQILAFSRRQMLEMKIVNLNEVIIEFEKMLHRLIGENISLKTHLLADLPVITADKGQLEQVLLNLVVNARDAMPDGGWLTIETAMVMLDETYASRHTEVQPGLHVLLAVSDTGHGMDTATQQRIFEPFFTTKARGHGTGLGLSTVFGIVNQHGGDIWIHSELGHGTTFKIYLPVTETVVVTAEPESSTNGVLEGHETILVVEDETAVRQLVSRTLREHGYRVLEAGDPTTGLALTAAHIGPIHLLLTDVIMPGLNGWELYQQLTVGRRDLKVLYMSGYTDSAIAHHGVLDEGMAFLQKPFAIRSLLQKVRAVLG